MENLVIPNSLVVLKFHYGKRGSINPIISKTMGRVAVINHAYEGSSPQPGTFWLCRINKEINSPNGNGCFIVTPLKQTPLEAIIKLIPGTYDLQYDQQNVICLPKVPNHYWICPASIKKLFLKPDIAKVQYQSVIVPIIIEDPPTEIED